MPETAKEILSMHIPQADCEDQYHWVKNANGRSIVSSVYNLFLMDVSNQNLECGVGIWKRLWKSDLLPKWKVFIWKIMHRALAMKNRLRKRGIDVDTDCCLCKRHEENETHLFRDCFVADLIWKTSPLGIITHNSQHLDVRDWIPNFLSYFWKEDVHDSPRARLFVAVLWAIWLHRNEVTFRKVGFNPSSIMHYVISYNRQAMQSSKMKQSLNKERRNYDVDQGQVNSMVVLRIIFTYCSSF